MTAQTILPANTLSSGYDVANSLMFDDGSTPYLTRTISSGADMTAFTFSFWLKRSTLGATQRIISSDHTDSKDMYIRFESDDTFGMYHRRTASENVISGFGTAAKFKDTSAWYHFVINMDSNESTEADRLKMYVNGTRVTTFAGTVHYPTSGEYANFFNSSEKTDIGYYRTNNGENFDGYLAEVVAIQGTAYQASSFGEFDSDSPNIWKPKDVSGLTFGTNGFYMEFQQSGTSQNSSGMGADTSGNDNHFATSGLASTDQTTDTCTNNYATLNPNQSNNAKDSVNSLAEGNLRFNDTNNADWRTVIGTLGVNSGKWYWEAEVVGMNGSILVGVGRQNYLTTTLNKTSSAYPGADSGDFSASYRENGTFFTNGSSSSGKSTFTSAGDIVMVALDMDNGAVYFGVNGTWNDSGDPTSGASKTGASYTGIQTGEFYSPSVSGSATNSTIDFNFGNPPFTISSGNTDSAGYGNFEYSVPSGYYALNSKNLAKYG